MSAPHSGARSPSRPFQGKPAPPTRDIQDEEIDRRDSSSPLLDQNAQQAFVAQQHTGFNFRRRTIIAAVMVFVASILALYGLAGWSLATPDAPGTPKSNTSLVVELSGYGTFKGRHLVRLEQPVDAWLGIDYAKPPLNESRFAPPEWPEPFSGTKAATAYGPICIQNNGSPQSEACLSFNLHRTGGVPLSRKLPVLVFIHGGAFVMGSGKSFDGAQFVAQSAEPLVVVTFQYRLGALGSVPSQLFEQEGLLNLGIRDQRLLLEFLQQHLASFGGDPKAVTIAGQSAGAHSVGFHLFHNYGTDKGKPLFAKAILASGSPTARAFPEATFPLYERQFKEFMTYLDCPESPNEEALACLRAAPISDIQYISVKMYQDTTYNITTPWQPVSPGPLLEKRGSQGGVDGSFFRVPTMLTTTTDEGKLFTPHDLLTTEEFRDFMYTVNPGLTEEDLDDLEQIYPDPLDQESPYYDSPLSTQYNRISAAYGDFAYICPVQDTADILATARSRTRPPPVYKARFNTPNWAPDWQGVPHASDGGYFNGQLNVEYPDISTLYASYWASFVVSGDPNKFALKNAPTWDRYEGTGSLELVVGSMDGVGTGMEEEGEDDIDGGQGIRLAACEWWRDPERQVRLGK